MLQAQTHLIRLAIALNRVARGLISYGRGPCMANARAPERIDGFTPWPALLDGMRRDLPVSAAIERVMNVQEHVLAMVEGAIPYDPSEAVMILQHLADGSASEWSKPARRLAAALGHELQCVPHDYGAPPLGTVVMTKNLAESSARARSRRSVRR